MGEVGIITYLCLIGLVISCFFFGGYASSSEIAFRALSQDLDDAEALEDYTRFGKRSFIAMLFALGFLAALVLTLPVMR